MKRSDHLCMAMGYFDAFLTSLKIDCEVYKTFNESQVEDMERKIKNAQKELNNYWKLFQGENNE